MNKHLFFDLDRTLWDFEKNSENALKQLFTESFEDHQIESFHKFHQVYKEINAQLWVKYGKGKITKDELRDERFNRTFQKFDLFKPELGNYFGEEYIRISPYQTALFPNTIETLETLKKEGYQMHIITNGFKEVQHIKLENSGLKPYFNVILSSEELSVNKPNPIIFKKAMELASAKPIDSVMIGDDLEVDVIGATNAGMHAIHFDPLQHMKSRTDGTRIRNLNELPQLIPFLFR